MKLAGTYRLNVEKKISEIIISLLVLEIIQQNYKVCD